MCWTCFIIIWELHKKSGNFFFVCLLNRNKPEKGPVSQQWANDARQSRRTMGKGLSVSQHELAAPWSVQAGSEEHASLILAFVDYLVMQK